MLAEILRFVRRAPAAVAVAPASAITPDQGLWLLAAAAVTLMPHAGYLPAWLSALCGLLLLWRALLLWQRRPPPHRLVLLLLTLGSGIGVRFAYGHFFGKDPGVALLGLLLCLKLLEIRSARDIRAAVLLCFFLQMALFFEDQSLPVALLALCGTLVAIIALLALADPAAAQRERIRTGALLLAQGLPFMLMLFLLFPRVQGPLWGLPADAGSARSGLSDSMSPGSISDLSESPEIAFRAEFVGPLPEPALRYWRGPVLTEFDGRTWRSARMQEAGTPFYTPSGRRFDYRSTLEAHDQRWLLALDYPGAGSAPLRYSNSYQALLPRALQTRTRFELSAYPDTPTGPDEPMATLTAALKLPDGYNPRSRQLATRLAAGAASDAVILDRVITHLRSSEMTYTLRPPLLGRDSVDEFLFDTRRGFCEHFASAFTVLMRAAGVPARVVAGYQGGELNPIDGNLVIRQSDAHAWAEVWLTGRGWVRVDPTALAAPQRIESGLAAALPAGEALPLMMRQDLTWLRHLRHRWEALSNTWNQRVLGYNPDRQRELLARLGFARDDWAMLVGLMAGATVLLIGLLFAWATWQRRVRDPLQRSWQTFGARLARKGHPRAPWEGPMDYGTRLANALPRHADELRTITATYARLRYGQAHDDADIRALNRQIRKLRLQ
jgi:transglutaminase-like putative cysteine protease